MSDIIIKVEDLSKIYQLGKVGTGSFKKELQYFWSKHVLKKQALSHLSKSTGNGGKEWIWALKNINLEIHEGEALGIIGSNGSGKSTLLKILSRIVQPTSGRVMGNGRVSSLLEVGTGFDDELTGRDNIFISGSIMGMTNAEIRRKFDEIVAFSGVEKFIDTPVKRYSSGMYVRLAFAVAAFLEPDILIVDEVLAVGDADFQKKCLGKMNETATKKGRTVIFVSHSMPAISNLCSKAVWLERGVVRAVGKSKSVVAKYLGNLQRKKWRQEFTETDNPPGNEFIRVLLFELVPHLDEPDMPIDIRTSMTVKYKFFNNTEGIPLAVGLHLFTGSGECVFDVSHKSKIFRRGILEGECEIPGNFLNNGAYYMSIIFVKDSSEVLYYYQEALQFEVEDYREDMNWYGDWMGMVRPSFPVTLRQSTSLIS